ncbi:E3 ubiquitin-protein ligase TRIM39-like isoform X3 [Polypterus senegalus]|uniref:E3 ubiquitin-protein ligase TRIM39-like isoform X3 n=1 Tax=Polypterus senegalus TaxID=55291 RepID=UPI001965770F|nr:E3 ubiquitin-protein ligase TRIM39-like isoform X3 [Polypterus senegalus]
MARPQTHTDRPTKAYDVMIIIIIVGLLFCTVLLNLNILETQLKIQKDNLQSQLHNQKDDLQRQLQNQKDDLEIQLQKHKDYLQKQLQNQKDDLGMQLQKQIDGQLQNQTDEQKYDHIELEIRELYIELGMKGIVLEKVWKKMQEAEAVTDFIGGGVLIFLVCLACFICKKKSRNDQQIQQQNPLDDEQMPLRNQLDDEQMPLQNQLDDEQMPLQNQLDVLKQKYDCLELEINELYIELEKKGIVLDKVWKQMQEAEVDIILKQEAAHAEISVDADGELLRFNGFTIGSDKWYCVTGNEIINSVENHKKYYWEVEVGGKSSWAIGLASQSIKEMELIHRTPKSGFWIMQLFEKKLSAVSSTVTEIQRRLNKVGVYLRWGNLSFYDLETKEHMHTFYIDRYKSLYTVFSPGSDDKVPLIIKKKTTVVLSTAQDEDGIA